MPVAVQVDTVTLTESTDFADLARRVLAGDGGFGSYPGDRAPVDWALRAYQQLRGTPYADRLADGVAGCLTDPAPEIRAQALVFVQAHPAAAGGERITELAGGDRSLFAGVPDPLRPGVDLEWQLLSALAGRLDSDPRAVELARVEVLRAGQAEPLIAALAAVEPDWVIANAERITAATPRAGATILITLQSRGTALVPLARRLARLAAADPRFGSDVVRFVDDPAIRRAILQG